MLQDKQPKAKAKPKTKAKAQKKPRPLTPMDLLKLEIAEEIGLLDKVKKVGWEGLSVAEAGRIGGYMTQRLKAMKKGQEA